MTRVTVALLKFAAALLLTPAGPSAPAHAVTVDINIRTGTNLSSGRRITCREKEEPLLRNRGFREVRRIDCRGGYFVYRAWRRNNRFENRASFPRWTGGGHATLETVTMHLAQTQAASGRLHWLAQLGG